MYTIDRKLPASGYRSKERNGSLVLLSLREESDCIRTIASDEWRFSMAVDTLNHTYHAVLRCDSSLPVAPLDKPVTELELPQEAIEALVGVALDPEFMSLGRGEVFPDVFILDGVSVTLGIRSSAGRFRMTDNVFMITEEDGIIPTRQKHYQTGLHLIRKAIAEALGEEEAEE